MGPKLFNFASTTLFVSSNVPWISLLQQDVAGDVMSAKNCSRDGMLMGWEFASGLVSRCWADGALFLFSRLIGALRTACATRSAPAP